MPAQADTLYPTGIDTWVFPQPDDTLATPNVEHDLLHGAVGNAIRQLEIKLGINASPNVGSVDYVLSHHTHQGTDGSQKFAVVSTQNALTTDLAFASRVASETNDRFQLQAGGKMQWGPGSAGPETTLNRGGARYLGLLGGINFQNVSAPGTPTSGYTLYSASSVMVLKDSAGATPLAFQTAPPQIAMNSASGTERSGLAYRNNAQTSVWRLISDSTAAGVHDFGLYDDTAARYAWISDSNGVLKIPSATGRVDLSAAGGTAGATGTGTGDKISLYSSGGTGYGFGIQGTRLVAYVPSGSALAVRQANASGNASSGTDAIVLAYGGTVQAIGQGNFGGGALAASAGFTRVGNTSDDALVLAQHGVAANANLRLRALGTGSVMLENSAGNPVVTAGISGAARTLGFFAGTPTTAQTVSGSRGGNAALGSLLTALNNYSLITDSTTA